MLAPVVLTVAILATFLGLARVGTTAPWSGFRWATAALAAFVLVSSLEQPLVGLALVIPILAARRLARPLAAVPATWSESLGTPDLAKE